MFKPNTNKQYKKSLKGAIDRTIKEMDNRSKQGHTYLSLVFDSSHRLMQDLCEYFDKKNFITDFSQVDDEDERYSFEIEWGINDN